MKSLTLAALILILSFPSSVFSKMDVGAVAASLPDEASECRFLLNLCQSYKELQKDAELKGDRAQRNLTSENLAAFSAVNNLATKYLLDVGRQHRSFVPNMTRCRVVFKNADSLTLNASGSSNG